MKELNDMVSTTLLMCMQKRLTQNQFLDACLRKHGNTYDYTNAFYTGTRNNVEIICRKHGKFSQRANDHINGGHGCPICARSCKTPEASRFVELAKQVHGNKFDYSKTQYINESTKVTIICRKHGEWKTLPKYHVVRKCDCPKCVRDKKLLTYDEFVSRAKLIHGEKYEYSQCKQSWNGLKCKMPIECKVHGIFFQSGTHHLSGRGCRKCFYDRSSAKNGIFDASKIEAQFLDAIGVPKLRNIHRQVWIGNYKVDALINNSIIEFLGDYWHGHPSYSKYGDITRKQQYTKTKLNALKNMGFDVFYIWESEWKKNLKDSTSISLHQFNGNLEFYETN